MFQPPVNPQEYQVPPREYVFIMDVSGSMRGFPIDVSKALLTDLVGGLRQQDRFNMVFFAGGNYLLSSSSLPATQENIDMAITAINNELGGGGTELLNALNTALSLPGTENFSRTFVIATDGYVSVERESYDLIRKNLGKANFFAFGIGSSPNRSIIEGIAHVGMGEPFIALNQNDAEISAVRFRKYIEYPVLTNIDVNFTTFGIYDVEPPHIPDVFAERPVLLFGKYMGDLSGEIKISGLSGSQTYTDHLNVSQHKAESTNEALRYLWARHKIQLMDDYARALPGDWTSETDYKDSVKNEITALGLKYNLLTRYTSFVAIDSIVRTDSGRAVTVNQPLPLPEGATDAALGGYSTWGPTASGFATAGNFFGSESYNTPDKGMNAGQGQQEWQYSLIVSVFPNPFTSQISLRIFIQERDVAEPKTIKLYDALGKLVDAFEITAGDEGWHFIELDFSAKYPELPPGMYSAILLVGEKQSTPVHMLYMQR